MSAPRHVAESWARKAQECLEMAQECRDLAYGEGLELATLFMGEALYWIGWARYYEDLLAQGVH